MNPGEARRAQMNPDEVSPQYEFTCKRFAFLFFVDNKPLTGFADPSCLSIVLIGAVLDIVDAAEHNVAG